MMRLTEMNLRVALILLSASAICFNLNASSPDTNTPSASSESTNASSDTGVLPKSVDLRPSLLRWGLDTRLQHRRNTCSVFVVVEALEFALASKGKLDSRLSVEFLNWAKNQSEHESEDGACFSELWTGFEAFGICPETEMPYLKKYDPANLPSAETIAHAKEVSSLGLKLHWIKEWDADKGVNEKELAEIKKTLARGWPVCGGFLWPKSSKVSTKMLKVIPRSEVIDGHSVFLVGYRDDETQPGGGVFLFRNTAGKSRKGQMTYEYALTYMNDAIYVDYDK
jgi:hypothetical protein